MTVRAYKVALLRHCGVRSHFDFVRLSEAHRAIWARLNEIGGRGLRLDPVPHDIDAATEMTAEEVRECDALAAAARGA